MTGRPILTAAAMRAAEAAAIAAGTSVEALMDRAGAALAEAVFLYVGPRPVLVLCGPGNNGGDGYVAARHLRARGVPVRVAALGESRWRWDGPVEDAAAAEPADVLVDCLFGTGLKRGLDERAGAALTRLAGAARIAVACDLPSGVDADSGALLSPVPDFELTVTFGALKPAHRLMPAMTRMGRVVLADIGVDAASDWHEIGPPKLPPLDAERHKYQRGMVGVLAGAMPGAAALAASAAARSGAGYVKLFADDPLAGVPSSVVQGQAGDIADERIGALLAGPGLGQRGDLLDAALNSGRPLVLDADALGLLERPGTLRGLDAIITPHEGEFRRLFGSLAGTKPQRAADAARKSGAVVVAKGPDTVVASADGRIGFAPPAPAWLASAGTGDVLAGMIAALKARGMDGFEAACAGVWLHGRAAELAGPAMIADDLVAAIAPTLARFP